MSDDNTQQPQAYCVKCRTKRDLRDPEAVFTKTGVPASTGQCEVCGTKLYRMGATAAHASLPKPEKVEAPKRKTKKKAKKSATKRKPKRRNNVGKLVIVESPAKARSIGGFLGKDYTVMSSKGHVRDLPSYSLAVDVSNNFEPTYRVLKEKRDVVKELKQAAESAEEIYLAMDPDREGEAIAWHLIAAAKMPQSQVKRVIFHEITDNAVADAFAQPRSINLDLVNAQQARRIIDRLVGYKVSGLLRRKARRGLTAGRVQSIALRLVVEREREIQAFAPVEYWTIDALLRKQASADASSEFQAGLIKIDGNTLARNSDDLDKAKSVAFHQREDIEQHLETLQRSQYQVLEVKRGTRQRSPSPPFTTSTLQQAASNRLGFSARKTMQIAQQLYEGIDIGAGKVVGFITYMRTDSLTVSAQAITEARRFLGAELGKDFVPKKPRMYKTKAKGAQEAHEAIRPTSALRRPDDAKPFLNRDQYRLYRLIWERFLASQTSNAVYDTLRVDIGAGLSVEELPYLFRATGSSLRFAGFLAISGDSRESQSAGKNLSESSLAAVVKDEVLNLRKLLPEQHFTQPPPRYTEASLVRALEENGIGRPSTYAPTVTLIQSPERDYIKRDGRQLIPTETGCLVSDLLSQYFDVEMDYAFTAKMEEQLDSISSGSVEWRPMLDAFYGPFEERLESAWANMPKQDLDERIGRNCPTCGDGELVIKFGRWGKFIGCANFPDCRHTEPFLEKTGVPCPNCGEERGGELVERRGKKGKRRLFYGCSRFPDCDYSTWNLPKDSKKAAAERANSEIVERSAG